MSDFLPFIVVGLTSGSVYGLAGTGLVLTYKTSGIFNFAHGAVGAAAAYVFFEFHVTRGWPWPVALIVCLVIFGPIAGIVFERFAKGLADVSPAMKIVATVGLLVGVQGLLIAAYGGEARNFPQFLPTKTFRVAGVNVGYDQLIVMLIALGAAVALYLFFRSTRLGVAMRGVVDNPNLLGLSGTSPQGVRRWGWLIGSSFAALSGILLAPTIGLDAILLTLLVVQAFGAAAIGAFSSVAMTYVGGLLIGIGAALATKYVGSVRALEGFPASLPFIVLFLVLILVPKGRLVEPPYRPKRITKERRPPKPQVLYGGSAVFAILLVLVPNIVGTRLPIYTNALIQAIVFLSLALLVRTSGQVSLAQAGFAAVGASTFAHAAVGWGLPWVLAVLVAGLVTVPIGVLIAVPAIRLAGLYLALATLGFGILLERMVYRTSIMFGTGSAQVLQAPRPSFAQSDKSFYYVVLVVALLAVLVTVLVHRSRLGRLLRAMADSPLALDTLGASVNLTKVLVFAIAAFLAGVAGALTGPLTGTINGVPFPALLSLSYLVVLALASMGGAGEIRAAIGAALALTVIPSYIGNQTFNEYLPVLFGVAAIQAALMSALPAPSGAAMKRFLARIPERAARSPIRDRLITAVRPVSGGQR